MIVIRRSGNEPTKEVIENARKIHEMTNDDVIVMPNSMDILFNMTLEDLEDYRDQINEIIKKKKAVK